MTQKQLLQNRAKAIEDFEKEIIELKHINNYLSEELRQESKIKDYYMDGFQSVLEQRNSMIQKSFWLGLFVGIIYTIAIISIL